MDGNQSFYQNFTTYESGFGDLCGNFWWGNANIKAFTSSFKRLKVVLTAFDGDAGHQTFDEFKLVGKQYKLDLGKGQSDGSIGKRLF